MLSDELLLRPPIERSGDIALICAGTSDLYVAEECHTTLRAMDTNPLALLMLELQDSTDCLVESTRSDNTRSSFASLVWKSVGYRSGWTG